MYGVTEDGNSVCCHIHGFTPYFYVSLPENFTAANCGAMKSALNKVMLAEGKSGKAEIAEPVLAVELVRKLNIYGYRGDEKQPFAKVTVAVPR